jgi:hypothetical protein
MKTNKSNPLADRKAYLDHLNLLKRAHKVELRNARMRLMEQADEVVTLKLQAFKKTVESEFDRFHKTNTMLVQSIKESQRKNVRLSNIIKDFNINTSKHIIRTTGNMQAIDVYMSKPHLLKNRKNEIKHKTKRIVNEFEEGYRVFQDLMVANLKYLEGKPNVESKECQVIDFDRIQNDQVVEDRNNRNLETIHHLKKDIDDQTMEFARKYQRLQLDFDHKEEKMNNEIKRLQGR